MLSPSNASRKPAMAPAPNKPFVAPSLMFFLTSGFCSFFGSGFRLEDALGFCDGGGYDPLEGERLLPGPSWDTGRGDIAGLAKGDGAGMYLA
jgi:hypothetical protein